MARVFLEDKLPALADDIEFDSEAGMFCARSTNKTALKQFAKALKAATEDLSLMRELLSLADPD